MGVMKNMVVKGAKGLALSAATSLAVSSISKVLGMSDSLVAQILAIGIPMMTFLAAEDPKITDLLFDESKKEDRKKEKSREEAEDGFFNIFGEKGHRMNKAIAEETGATEEEVNGVMGLFLDTFVDAIAEEDPEDSKALGKLFKEDVEELEKESPSLVKMAKRIIS